jgi:hypothetical protein
MHCAYVARVEGLIRHEQRSIEIAYEHLEHFSEGIFIREPLPAELADRGSAVKPRRVALPGGAGVDMNIPMVMYQSA